MAIDQQAGRVAKRNPPTRLLRMADYAFRKSDLRLPRDLLRGRSGNPVAEAALIVGALLVEDLGGN
jgi:hypothetical protein